MKIITPKYEGRRQWLKTFTVRKLVKRPTRKERAEARKRIRRDQKMMSLFN